MLKDIRNNPILLTDSYNPSHQKFKVNTDWETSHIYNRKEGMILYGFNEIVHSVLNTRITLDMIDEAQEKAKHQGISFPYELWLGVVRDLNGYVPLLVQSLPEGMWIPKGTPFAQVRNTVEGYGEMVTWFEGIFLHSSFSCGCATEALHLRRYAEETLKEHGAPLHRIHSFGFRGHRSLEDAYWAGTAWNLFLHGSDDIHTLQHTPNAQIGTIGALAHKVTQQFDNEYDCYVRAIDTTAEVGEGIVALVIDTYDAYRFIDEYLVPLSNYAKSKGVHIVARPDSGDVLEQTVSIYHKTQSYGLDNVSVIIGEDMSYQNIKRADFYFGMKQVPLSFVSYGIGGGFYNHINRDTLGFAMKTAYSNGRPRMKFGMVESKRSIPDKVALVQDEFGHLRVVREKTWYGLPLENQYQNIYMYDQRMRKPQIVEANWDETQQRALQYVEGELQESIVIGEDIKLLVKEFEKTYA